MLDLKCFKLPGEEIRFGYDKNHNVILAYDDRKIVNRCDFSEYLEAKARQFEHARNLSQRMGVL